MNRAFFCRDDGRRTTDHRLIAHLIKIELLLMNVTCYYRFLRFGRNDLGVIVSEMN
jgi:hypothetical protein